MKILPNINYFNKEFWIGGGNCPCRIIEIIDNKCRIVWWDEGNGKYPPNYVTDEGSWHKKNEIIDNFQKGYYHIRKGQKNPKNK